jgi:hypothetical protein
MDKMLIDLKHENGQWYATIEGSEDWIGPFEYARDAYLAVLYLL